MIERVTKIMFARLLPTKKRNVNLIVDVDQVPPAATNGVYYAIIWQQAIICSTSGSMAIHNHDGKNNNNHKL
jgi:hypothetical protein